MEEGETAGAVVKRWREEEGITVPTSTGGYEGPKEGMTWHVGHQQYEPLKYGDFISRPGVPVASFSPQDTIIGMKQPEQIIGGNTTTNSVNININGYNQNPKELA